MHGDRSKATMSSRKLDWKEVRRVEDALESIDPEIGDEALMHLLADYLTTQTRSPYYFNIFHDVRPSSARRLARIQRTSPDYEGWGDPIGPCPVPYHWHRKNLVGVKIADREEARQWAIEAMRHGYTVWYSFKKRYGLALSPGSLANVREKARQRHQMEMRDAT
jgi:hypothetical protein